MIGLQWKEKQDFICKYIEDCTTKDVLSQSVPLLCMHVISCRHTYGIQKRNRVRFVAEGLALKDNCWIRWFYFFFLVNKSLLEDLLGSHLTAGIGSYMKKYGKWALVGFEKKNSLKRAIDYVIHAPSQVFYVFFFFSNCETFTVITLYSPSFDR